MFSRYFNTVRLRAYPRILRERMRDPQAPTPRADRIFIVLGILMHVVWMLLMGVDVMRLRYSPSMPVAIRMLGTGLLLAGKYCQPVVHCTTDPGRCILLRFTNRAIDEMYQVIMWCTRPCDRIQVHPIASLLYVIIVFIGWTCVCVLGMRTASYYISRAPVNEPLVLAAP